MRHPWQPTLREFILMTREYGLELHISYAALDTPRGPIRFTYVEGRGVRILLPALNEDDRLTPTVVASLCADLSLPPEDFGLDPDPSSD